MVSRCSASLERPQTAWAKAYGGRAASQTAMRMPQALASPAKGGLMSIHHLRELYHDFKTMIYLGYNDQSTRR